MKELEIAVYIGVDWGDERHSVHLQVEGSSQIEHLELEQKPDVLHEWVAQLRQRAGGRKVAIAIEQRKGAVIHALMMYDFLVLYPINPKALARYREAFRTSGAKDDPSDSELLLDLLSKHRDRLRAWIPDTVQVRKLQLLCEQRRKMVNQRVALTNRITSLLKQYFPQALDWVGEIASIQCCEFLMKWPNLAAVQRVRKSTLEKFYRSHNCRKASVIEERIAQIASARALTSDPAIVEPLGLSVQTYATQLRSLIRAIGEFDQRIADVFAQLPDHDVFESFPGAGEVCAPRLAAAFGSDRSRWDSAAQIQSHSGIAPVTERSGKALWIHHRLACPKFIKQSFHEFADQSIRFSPWARAYYDQQRGRGNDHHAALRALAFKWIRILFRCWKNRKPYDEEQYIQSLRRHGSTLVQHLASPAPIGASI
jgi:transposase